MQLKVSSFIELLVIVSVFRVATVASSEEATKDEAKAATQPATQKDLKAKYVRPVPSGDVYFVETFDEPAQPIGFTWIKSRAKKDGKSDDELSKYEGEWSIEPSVDSVLDGDKGLVLKSKAKHHAIATRMSKQVDFTKTDTLIVQYEVKFQQALECGGAYIKLIADEEPKLKSLEQFYDKTGFSIMFGPDKCGPESKFHFIVRYKHPLRGTVEEKHAKKSQLADAFFNDGKTHLYTLELTAAENKFRMLIDGVEINSGSLLKDLNPAINPPREIVDPEDKKPSGWDEREKIADPQATKPDDWDEEAPAKIDDPSATKPADWLDDEQPMISDETAVRPSDWDDETDGEWEAPRLENPKCLASVVSGCGEWKPAQIANPLFKGKWRAAMIDNPDYQGKWEPRKIDNPDFFEDNNPFSSLLPFSTVGIELWSMTEGIYFDNFLITNDKLVAEAFTKQSWELKKSLETINSRAESVIDGLVNAANEKPWIWGLYLLVILVPIVLITVFCFGNKKKGGEDKKKSAATNPTKTESAKSYAEGKKTDRVNEDDDAEEDKEQEQEQEEQEEEDKKKEEKEEDEEEEKEKEKEKEPTPSPKASKRRTARKD